MTHLSRLSVPAYAVCLWLVLFTGVDAVLMALPASPTDPVWRHAVANVVTQHMLAPIMGVFLALVLGAAFEQTMPLRAVVAVSGLAGLGLVILLAVFLRDSIGLRGVESEAPFPLFSLRWAVIVVKLVFSLVIAGALFHAARALANGESVAAAEGPGVVHRPS